MAVQHNDENSYFSKHGPTAQDGIYGDTWEKKDDLP